MTTVWLIKKCEGIIASSSHFHRVKGFHVNKYEFQEDCKTDSYIFKCSLIIITSEDLLLRF